MISLEMLLKGAHLPAKKKVMLQSVLNYPKIGIFQVVYRHSLLDPHVEIASVPLPSAVSDTELG